ncbi:hypothetical protein L0F63_002268 [Massospora cicadina]|nr:hypothetical protein L0F63_002268 [Massospora cicadina]
MSGFHYTASTPVAHDKDWQRCSKLRLEPAKPSGLDRLAKEREENSLKPSTSNPVRRQFGVIHAKDMTLMRDELVDCRKKWKKVRYGRAVAELKIRSKNGRLIYYDPTSHQHQLKSFAKKDSQLQDVINSVPLANLTWSIDVREPAPESLVYPERIKEISKVKQVISIEQKAESIRQRKEILRAALSNLDTLVLPPNPNRIVFDRDLEEESQPQKSSLFINSDDETDHRENKSLLFGESNDYEDGLPSKCSDLFDNESVENEQFDKDKRDSRFLFGDNEESDEDVELEIKRVFEGEQGHQRLKMQRRFGNDPRFKMDDNFIDSDEESATEVVFPKTEEEQLDVDFAAEKSKALSVLQDVLGLAPSSTALDVAVAKMQTGVEWKEMVRYDPDASDAEELEIDAKDLMPASQVKKLVAPSAPLPCAPQASLPKVSSEKFFTVSSSIGSLFKEDVPRTEGLFSFVGSDDDIEEPPVPNLLGLKPLVSPAQPASTTQIASAADASFTLKEPLFFFHLGNPELRVNFSEERPVFCRTDPAEFLETEWGFRRKQMIRDFKTLQRRHASLSYRKF